MANAGSPKRGSRCWRRSPAAGRPPPRSSATRSPCWRARSPTARASLGAGGCRSARGCSTTLSAAGRIVRASNDGGWTTSRPRWASTESWLGQGDPAAHPGRGRGGAGRAMAARLRARHRGGHQVVAGVDRRGRARGAGRPRGGRGRPRRPGRIPAARRHWTQPTRSSPGPRSCRRSIRPRWAGPSATGTSAPTGRSCSTPAATPGPPCGGTGGSWAAGASATTARSTCRCSRTWARTDCAPSSTEAARLTEWLGGTRVLPRFPSPLSKELAGS